MKFECEESQWPLFLPAFCSPSLFLSFGYIPRRKTFESKRMHNICSDTQQQRLLRGLTGKNPPAYVGDTSSIPGSGKSHWKGKELTPVFFPRKSYGQRSLEGYRPWGCKEVGMTEQPSTHPRINTLPSRQIVQINVPICSAWKVRVLVTRSQ